MTTRQQINNEIDHLKTRIKTLEAQRDSIKGGYVKRLEEYLKLYKNIAPWNITVVDSIKDNTCGVLLGFYRNAEDELKCSKTIMRSPHMRYAKSLFENSKYEILTSYATPKGLVLEVREN